MGRSQRRKGAERERELAAKLSEDFGRVVRRNIGQARDGGDDITTLPFRWEAKARKAFSVWEFMDQCAAACQAGERPIVALRADGRPWLVLMRYEDAVPMLRGEIV